MITGMITNWILTIWMVLVGAWYQDEIPIFRGGQRALEAFIEEKIVYPGYSKQNCIQGTIEVAFKLTSEGRVVNTQVQKGLGIDLDDEALRIVRLTSGNWVVPKGFDTTNVMVIPISFSLTDYNCGNRTAKEIREAINNYKAQEELTGAITNFYAKKESGSYNAGDEQKIEQLKEQLGYDDEYIDQVIKQAEQKIKQGDKEGACEDLQFIKKIGSNRADKLIEATCR